MYARFVYRGPTSKGWPRTNSVFGFGSCSFDVAIFAVAYFTYLGHVTTSALSVAGSPISAAKDPKIPARKATCHR